MQEDFSEYFLGKKLFDVQFAYKDQSKDSSIKNIKLQLSRNHLDHSKPLTAKELHEMHRVKIFWKTVFSPQTALFCEVDLKHSSDIKLSLSKTATDFDMKLSGFFNAKTASKNYYILKLKHQIVSYSHLILWFKKMATSSNDSFKIYLKNRTKFEPYFDKLLMDFAFVNRTEKSDLDFRIKFYSLSKINQYLRYAFQCEFSSQNLIKPNMKVNLKLNDWNGLYLQLLWNLDIAQRKNIFNIIGKMKMSKDLSIYGKLSTKKEAHASISYHPSEGVELIQSVRFNFGEYMLNKDCLNLGIGFRLWV
jgi:hypothetical protein